MKYNTKIVQMGNNTGIDVPETIIESFGVGKKPPVIITLNNYTYRSTVAVMGGQYLVSLSAEHRKNANVAGGDEVEITIELDTEPRIVELPIDFKMALDKNKIAKDNFEKISNSKKKALVLSITDAKTEETKSKRIDKAINLLIEGKV